MSTSKADVFRGALKDRSKLEQFFKALDEHTDKKYLNLPYFDPKNEIYGTKTKYKGYRPVHYGTYKLIAKQFNVSPHTLFSRIQSFPNGVKETQNTGVKSVTYEKWEQTPSYKLIRDEIGADPNSVKAASRDPSRYKVKYTKYLKYNNACYLAWKAMGAKTDLLDASLEQWKLVWGKDSKSPNMCSPLLRDKVTSLLSYNYASPLRWIMKRSKDPIVKNLIIINDSQFNTSKLKRDTGQHMASYFSEEQCFLLPSAINQLDTLMMTFCGLLFGGRSSALLDLQVEKIVYDSHQIILFESKIQKFVAKDIFEPETSLIKQYVIDCGFTGKDYLFNRTPKQYNAELSATVDFFAKTDFPLSWSPTTHTAFKHTCVTQMSLHGVRMDTISDYIGTDPRTLKDFYRGGSAENIRSEIGGIEIKQKAATWRTFVIRLTTEFAKRYEELTGRKVNLAPIRSA
jgi:hypothetical protein